MFWFLRAKIVHIKTKIGRYYILKVNFIILLPVLHQLFFVLPEMGHGGGTCVNFQMAAEI